VKDFLAGIFMLVEDQYGVGDVVDVGEATGVVEAVSLRSTRLRSVNGTVWHVPNGEIRRVGNMSQQWSRALLDVEVAYGTDVVHASAVIQRVADEMHAEPEWRSKILDPPEIWGWRTSAPTAWPSASWCAPSPASSGP
jgi:moderate conductance mechanosensitive channel